MKQIVIDVLQTSILGTLSFILLLSCKQVVLRRCGIKYWHIAVLFITALFIFPLRILKTILSPCVQPIRVWIQEHISVFSKYQSNGAAVISVPNESLYRIIVVAWAVGLLVYFTVRWALYLSYANRLKKDSHVVPVFVYDIFANMILPDKHLNRFGRLRHVKLYCHDNLRSPIVYGIWRKSVVLPCKTFENCDTHEIYLMLRHEILHISHFDVEKRLFFLIAHAVNWFNPILFLLERNINEALEFYCDVETVENREDAQARLKYGELLISLKDNQRQYVVLHMANKKFIQKRLGYIMSPPQKVDKPFVALITFSMTLFISMCLMGFTMQYSQEQHINPYVTIDYAEKVQSTQWMPFDNDTTGYNLTERGEYIIEQLLYPNTVNYIEDEFLSHSGNMKLTLLESDSDVLVYLYNSANKEYPIMLVCLDQSLTPQTFSGLSYDYLYILGLIVDESSAKLTRILVSE